MGFGEGFRAGSVAVSAGTREGVEKRRAEEGQGPGAGGDRQPLGLQVPCLASWYASIAALGRRAPAAPLHSREPLPWLLPQAVLTPPPPVRVLARLPRHHTACPLGDSLPPAPQEGRVVGAWPPREPVRVDTCSGDLWVALRCPTWLTAGVRHRSVPPPGGGWVRAGLCVGSGGQLDGALRTIPVSFLEEPLGGSAAAASRMTLGRVTEVWAGWALPRGQFSRSPGGRGPW